MNSIIVFIGLFYGGLSFSNVPDPCEGIREAAARVNLFTKDSSFTDALAQIKKASSDKNEHCISFGKDAAGNMISSGISHGSATSGKVPPITNAFADLHNHNNKMPPDAGDLYGLISMNKNNPAYKTRFVITKHGTLYALLVTDPVAAHAFPQKYPPQPPAYNTGQPGFPVALVDEAREMKYMHNCTDEMVVAFILEKYNTGVSLLKQDNHGRFRKLFTSTSNSHGRQVYSAGICEF